MTSLPLPATTATSHARSSPPPLDVTERPLVSPISSCSSFLPTRNFGTPRYFGTSFATTSMTASPCRSARPPAAPPCADAGDLALERADAGFLRVVVDDRADRVLGDRERHVVEAALLALARHEVLHGDVELLELRVAGELDDLHAVLQRDRDAAERVRRRDEHHVREVVVEVEVVVVERVVLLGVEHLEQRRRRIAAEVGRHLVDLVEQEHRVVASRPS